MFPPSCIICGNLFTIGSKDVMCKRCLERSATIIPPFCHYCGLPIHEDRGNTLCKSCSHPTWSFDRARSYFVYSGIIKQAICAFKYKKNMRIGKWFAWKMGMDLSKKIDGQDRYHMICPVPLSDTKLRERGFNQSFILAQGISTILDIPIQSLLRERKQKQSQVGLDDKTRWSNIQGKFFITSGETINRKRILLIDDVFTTGATVNECAKMLKKNGASHVGILTLARAVERQF
ncbi:MAG: ComF family protein [bacterium]